MQCIEQSHRVRVKDVCAERKSRTLMSQCHAFKGHT